MAFSSNDSLYLQKTTLSRFVYICSGTGCVSNGGVQDRMRGGRGHSDDVSALRPNGHRQVGFYAF